MSLKHIFSKHKTEFQITLKWKEENVEQGNTEEETETEEENGLKQLRGSLTEQKKGNAFHWKRNGVLVVQGANEVF